jgi:hypothetical protein
VIKGKLTNQHGFTINAPGALTIELDGAMTILEVLELSRDAEPKQLSSVDAIAAQQAKELKAPLEEKADGSARGSFHMPVDAGNAAPPPGSLTSAAPPAPPPTPAAPLVAQHPEAHPPQSQGEAPSNGAAGGSVTVPAPVVSVTASAPVEVVHSGEAKPIPPAVQDLLNDPETVPFDIPRAPAERQPGEDEESPLARAMALPDPERLNMPPELVGKFGDMMLWVHRARSVAGEKVADFVDAHRGEIFPNNKSLPTIVRRNLKEWWPGQQQKCVEQGCSTCGTAGKVSAG